MKTATRPATTTYRAACLDDVPLTSPEHADLDDEALLDEAMECAASASIDVARCDIRITTWTQR